MTKIQLCGIAVLTFSLAYASFWTLAQRDASRAGYTPMHMSKEQFVHAFPNLNAAFQLLGVDPFRPPAQDRQAPETALAVRAVRRHMWLGYAGLCLGGALMTFGCTTWPRQALHYACVVGFGGALFTAAAWHPIFMSWNGK